MGLWELAYYCEGKDKNSDKNKKKKKGVYFIIVIPKLFLVQKLKQKKTKKICLIYNMLLF